MKMRSFAFWTFLLTFVFVSNAFGEGKVHWDYTENGPVGPANWGTLAPEFEMCAKGRNQSPINLENMIDSDLPFIQINYSKGGSAVLNNGHTIQVNYEPGSSITVAGQSFELKQFHFHSPSENTINGEFWPLEAHFVHADTSGNLAVIAVMFRTGENNSELEKAWSFMPVEAGITTTLPDTVDAAKLLPAGKDYYRFNGSLTTPPCSEGVLWMVMKAESTSSVEQIKKFTDVLQHPNNRPVQPVNARAVME